MNYMDLNSRKTYELTSSTMCLIAFEVDGSWKTKVLLDGGEPPFIVDFPPSKIIQAACKKYGEELISRGDGAKILCGFKNKPPIAISLLNNYYFFPTHSPTNPNCSWFSHRHIRLITKARFGGSNIRFINGEKLTFPVSEGIMNAQLHKTAQYQIVLQREMKPLEQRAAIKAILKTFSDNS